jgi:endogenous inhibitor of DNA gyrase (YacG/DUF329 family)
MSKSLGVDCPMCGKPMNGPSCDACKYREGMSTATCDNCGNTVAEGDIAVNEYRQGRIGQTGGRVKYCDECVSNSG